MGLEYLMFISATETDVGTHCVWRFRVSTNCGAEHQWILVLVDDVAEWYQSPVKHPRRWYERERERERESTKCNAMQAVPLSLQYFSYDTYSWVYRSDYNIRNFPTLITSEAIIKYYFIAQFIIFHTVLNSQPLSTAWVKNGWNFNSARSCVFIACCISAGETLALRQECALYKLLRPFFFPRLDGQGHEFCSPVSLHHFTPIQNIPSALYLILRGNCIAFLLAGIYWKLQLNQSCWFRIVVPWVYSYRRCGTINQITIVWIPQLCNTEIL
jgi:hypothetical protein